MLLLRGVLGGADLSADLPAIGSRDLAVSMKMCDLHVISSGVAV